MKKLCMVMLLGLMLSATYAQRQLKGSVLSTEGEPLVGVSIVVKGTTVGTVTDASGHFSLTMPEEARALVFSFVGFASKETPYTGQSFIETTLEESAKTLGEVTVQGFADMKARARKRAESIQSIPESIVVMGAEQMDDTGVIDVGSFLTQVPGIAYGESQDPGTVFINVRGIPQIRYGPSPVALVVDGVYFSDPNLNVQPLYDIEQVEVVKGPQGIFYGKNAIGGAIIITTKQPTNAFSVKARAGYGNGNAGIGSLAVSGPIIADKFYFRLSGNYAKSDGLIKNTTLDEYVDFNRDVGVRGLLKYDFSPNTSLSITGQYSSNRGGAITFISSGNNDDFPDMSPNVYTGSPKADFLGTGTLDSYFVSALLETNFNNLRFTSATSYTDTDLFYDGDYLSAGLNVDNYGPRPINTQDMTRASKAFNQEIRLSSAYANSPWNWTAGLFYQHIQSVWKTNQYVNNDTTFTDLTYASTTRISLTDDDNLLNSIGVFAFGGYDILDDLKVELGARAEFEFLENTENRTGKKSTEQYVAFQPKASVSYQVNEHAMTYFSLGGGFRSGGFNAVAIPADPASGGGIEKFIRPEYTLSYELGVKTTFWKRRALVNLAGFYTSFEDQQVYRFGLGDVDGDGVAGEVVLGTYNLKRSISAGFEADVKVRAFSFLDVVGGYSYIHTEITEPGEVAGYEEVSSKGNKIPFALQSSFNITLLPHYTVNDRLTLRASLGIENRGKRYWFAEDLYGVDQEEVFQDPYTLINVQLGADIGDHFNVTLWTKNVADTKYNNEWWPFSAFGAGDIRTPSQPRTFGAHVTYSF